MKPPAQHSQGWHHLKELSEKTHVDSNQVLLVMARIGQGLLMCLGFVSFVGLIALFN